MESMFDKPITTAIVDYGLGNLFSVKHACEHVGLKASITSAARGILDADLVILPGVGAFGDAMAGLERQDLASPLRDVAASGKPLVGICLGLQLMMTESHEFGTHKGLGLFEGPVVRFEDPLGPAGMLKVPQVGWNRIYRPGERPDAWARTPLQGLEDGEYLYFVHSYYAQPADPAAGLTVTRYGHIEFFSGLRKDNVYAFQFHPERSGPRGLQIYRNLATLAATSKEK